MNRVSNQVMEEYMNTLTIDLKREKIKDFYRYLDSSKYFKYDTEEEIEKTRNIWAGYAYLILMEMINGSYNLTPQEGNFFHTYYEKLLSKKPLNDYENQVNGLYIKYRLTKKFGYNHAIQLPISVKEDKFKVGLEEFIETLENMVSSVYQKNIKLDASRPLVPSITCSGSTIKVSSYFIRDAYLRFLQDGCNIKYPLNVVKEITKEIELARLEVAKKDEISKRAVIYTIEDYLESKTRKKTKLANVYNSLYGKIMINKKIVIDSNQAALDALNNLYKKFENSIYTDVDEKFSNYLVSFEEEVNSLEHFIKDQDYFDIIGLEHDGLSKLYKLYINGLKAMPRSKLTNVTKYFALNGDSLTLVEMDSIIEEYKWKIKYAKKEEKKKELMKEMLSIKEVMDYVQGFSYSYTIEDAIRKMSITDTDISDRLNLIAAHYPEYLDMKYRVTRALSNLDNFASSGSPTKTQLILNKKKELEVHLLKCEMIEKQIEKSDYLMHTISNIDTQTDVVVRRVKDYSRLVTMIQELTGKGISTCDDMLYKSIEYGEPIMKGLTPGFKKFVEEALGLKGAEDFKKKKKKTK